MERIIVIGCSGAGKSTLSRELAERYSLPLHHLDRLFWLPNWEERDCDEFRTAHDEIIQHPRWIIDGNYGSTMASRLAACDTVVYLDFPVRTCFWRVLKRCLLRRNRPDMAEGCEERIDFDFLRYVLNFRRDHRPRTERLLNDTSHCKVHRLGGPKEVRAFLSDL